MKDGFLIQLFPIFSPTSKEMKIRSQLSQTDANEAFTLFEIRERCLFLGPSIRPSFM